MPPALPFDVRKLRRALPSLRIGDGIAVGGQKCVLRCQYQGLDGCLKLSPNTPHARARMEREVETMRMVQSPNLVTVLSEEVKSVRLEKTDYIYFVEEYIEGNDLSRLMRKKWRYDEVITLSRDLCRAVEALWGYRIVHRDIKPANVRIRSGGQAVLLDVGLARHMDRASLTASLAMPGTPGYYSPEQIRRRRHDLDFRSDLFSVGICLYEVLGKINPFTYQVDGDLDEYEKRVLLGTVLPISRLDRSIPPSLAELVSRLLKPQANLRPRSFKIIEKLLGKAEEELRCHS